MIIDIKRRAIAINSLVEGFSLKKKIDMRSAIINSICPTARTGATALEEKA